MERSTVWPSGAPYIRQTKRNINHLPWVGTFCIFEAVASSRRHVFLRFRWIFIRLAESIKQHLGL